MAKDEKVEWRRMRRLNGEGSKNKRIELKELLKLPLLKTSDGIVVITF